MNRKGHRTPVPHKSSSRIWKLDGELCSKPRSKGRRDLPKGKATPNPRPGRPPSSSCFPAICKVACAHRRPSYRHRTPSRKISKCFLARWIFVSRGWITFPLTPPSFEFNASTEMSVRECIRGVRKVLEGSMTSFFPFSSLFFSFSFFRVIEVISTILLTMLNWQIINKRIDLTEWTRLFNETY